MIHCATMSEQIYTPSEAVFLEAARRPTPTHKSIIAPLWGLVAALGRAIKIECPENYGKLDRMKHYLSALDRATRYTPKLGVNLKREINEVYAFFNRCSHLERCNSANLDLAFAALPDNGKCAQLKQLFHSW